jgi:thiol-disulfide isomerase/thioredoxin
MPHAPRRNSRRNLLALAGLSLAAIVATAAAQESTPAAVIVPATRVAPPTDAKPAAELTLGSKAPVPEISNFIRGTRPEFFEPGKTYVVEFWATWCGPCRTSMPHLSDLAEKHRDRGLVVVGVSDEDPAKVETFLSKDEWKQKARYTLATDPDRSTHDAYMKAAGQQGIPTAFIVKDGTVQWIGHPMEMDAPLEKVLAGTWDIASAKRDFDAAMEADRKANAKQHEIARAYESKDWPKVLSALDELIADSPVENRAYLQMNKASVLLQADRAAEAYALIESTLKARAEGPLYIVAAGVVLQTPGIKDRRVDQALTWLDAALAQDQGISPQALDLMATAWEAKGDRTKAADCLKRAIDAAKSWGPAADDYVADLRERLKDYEAAPAPTGGASAPATTPPAK